MELDTLLPIIVLCVVIVFISGLWVWDKIRFDRRERDFLNRLMSRSFLEYTSGTRQLERPQAPPSGIDALVEEMNEAQEESVRIG